MTGKELERHGELDRAEATPGLRGEWQSANDYLQTALSTLDQLTVDHPEDPYGLAAAFLIANRIKRNAALLSERVETMLHDLLPDKQLVVDGIGVIEKGRQSKGTEWDQDEAWKRVRRLLAPEFVDEETGEVNPERAELVEAALELVRELVSPPVWRKTEFRRRGVEPEGDLCESRYGRKTVRIYNSGGSQ